MVTYRLQYKFLFMFLIFSTALIMAISIITYYGSSTMVQELERLGPLTSEQRAAHEKYVENITETLISLSFYIFVLAFILSLFFTRRFMVPIKELHRGAKAIRDGRFDIRLDVTTSDEFGEVTRAFNEMADVLRKKTQELMRKDLYIKTMVDPIWVVDEDNIIVDVNPAFTKLFGYEREDILGSSIFDLLDADAEKIMRSQLQDREKGASSMYELSIISKTQGMIPVLISGTPVLDGGEVVGKIGIIKDFRREAALREALKEEKDRTVAIMDSMTDYLLVINRDFKIVQANIAARMNAGGEVAGKNCHEIFHKRGERCFMHGTECPVKMVFETGKPFKTVHEHIEEGGRRVYREIISYPVKDRHGEVKHAVEIMRDITERKRFEEEIELKNRELTTLNSISRVLSQSLRAEDIFNSVLEKVIGLTGMDGGGIFFLDEMGRELRCKYHKGLSEDFIRSTGRLKVGDDIPGRVALTGQGLISPDISKDARGEKSILKHSGIKGYAAIPIRGKEKLLGVFYIFSFGPHIFTTEEEKTLGSVSEMMGIAFENISLYEKMRGLYDYQRQRRVREQQNFLNISNMLAATIDIKSVLASSLSLIKESCGADFAWLLEPDSEGNLRVNTSLSDAVQTGEVVFPEGTTSLELYAAERKRPVTLSEISSDPKFYLPESIKGYSSACSVPIYIGDKTLGVFTLFYRTPKGPSQEDMDFLLAATGMFAVAIERAKLYEKVIMEKAMADKMKTEFVKQVSHAFRTPLSAIVGMTEMILNEDISAARSKEYLGIILSEGNRLSDLVSDLLDLTKIESGRAFFNITEIDFAAIIRNLRESFSARISGRGINFEPSIKGDVKGYHGDGEKLEQALRNLIDNSLAYSDRGCSVGINVERAGDSVVMTVSDTGWGMEEEDLKRAGEKFFRGKNSASTKGSGLGLSLVREIVKVHGGRLDIKSEPGKGTAVTIELPYEGATSPETPSA